MAEKEKQLSEKRHCLLYLDESYSDMTRTWSLTGICIPLSQYAEVRLGFYRIIRWLTNPLPLTFDTNPVELHGADLLRSHPEVDDSHRVQLLSEVAELLLRHNVSILRVGRRYKGQLPSRETVKTGVWLDMMLQLMKRPEGDVFIPVMDGFDPETVETMSGLLRGSQLLHAAGFGDPSDYRFNQLVGEVFYADSRYSVFTQVADLVSYLRHVADKNKLEIPLSEFSASMANISQQIDPLMFCDRIQEQ